MRRIGKKNSNQVKFIVFTSLSLLCILTVGYAAFSTNLNLNAKGNIKQITAAKQLQSKVVTSGEGLYKDIYEEGRYIYKGANPSNYITFNNEIWRIMSVEPDGTLKIIGNESIGTMAWDTSDSNDWTRPATLNTYLNNDYYNSLSSEARSLIQSHTWGIGQVTYNNTDLAAQIQSENETTWNGNVGLMSVSEFIRSNINTEQCGNFSLSNTNYRTCKTTTYYITPTTGYLWTISPYSNSSVFSVLGSGYFGNYGAYASYIDVLPALYLTSDIRLEGEGTNDNPYTIVS